MSPHVPSRAHSSACVRLCVRAHAGRLWTSWSPTWCALPVGGGAAWLAARCREKHVVTATILFAVSVTTRTCTRPRQRHPSTARPVATPLDPTDSTRPYIQRPISSPVLSLMLYVLVRARRAQPPRAMAARGSKQIRKLMAWAIPKAATWTSASSASQSARRARGLESAGIGGGH